MAYGANDRRPFPKLVRRVAPHPAREGMESGVRLPRIRPIRECEEILRAMISMLSIL